MQNILFIIIGIVTLLATIVFFTFVALVATQKPSVQNIKRTLIFSIVLFILDSVQTIDAICLNQENWFISILVFNILLNLIIAVLEFIRFKLELIKTNKQIKEKKK